MKTNLSARYHVVCALIFSSPFFWGGISSAQDSQALGFNVLSPEKEAAMGKKEFQKYKKERKIVKSGREYQMVQGVASQMTKIVKVENAAWEFVLFDDPTPNAFALPGGKVGVHTGLFKVADNEAQLAAVIGHELAHVTERHSGKRISDAMIGSGLGAIAGALLQRKTGMKAKQAQVITQGAATLQVLRFSRKQELEADSIGTIYMAKAGYNPREAIELWKQFSAYNAKNGGSKVPGFLSTHPVDSKRIEELQAMMPKALSYYKPGSKSSSSSSSSSKDHGAPVRALRVGS